MKLTENMRKALCAVVDGISASRVISGRGRNVDATLIALKNRGLLVFGRTGGTMGWEPTEAGRSLVRLWRSVAGSETGSKDT